VAAQGAHRPGKRAEKLAKRCDELAQLSVRLPLLGQSPGALCLIARVAVSEHRDSSLFVIIWLRADPGGCARGTAMAGLARLLFPPKYVLKVTRDGLSHKPRPHRAAILVLFILMETIEPRSPLSDLRIVGGNLALDFVNTRGGPRHGPAATEWLSSYEDFAAWASRVGVSDPSAPPGENAPRSAALAAFARVQACRDDMDEIFRALADSSVPPASALRRLQLAYVEALANGQLVRAAQGCAWRWDSGSSLLAPLWPVVAAAVELLTDGPAGHIKPCHACRFVFIDNSKNSSRRWCSMDDCGKEAKIARYLERRSHAHAS
jgi:predicted RNA-binding Zn ribbon-like protein